MNFHIYAKGETKNGFEFEGILNNYYRISNDVIKRLGGRDKAIEELKKQVNVNQHIKKRYVIFKYAKCITRVCHI